MTSITATTTFLETPTPSATDDSSLAQRAVARRVLHVINGQHYSGAERVQDLLALQLPAMGYQVGFACLLPETFPERRLAQSSPLWKIPMHSRLDWTTVGRLIRVYQTEQFEMLHAHTPRTLMVAAAAARRLNCPLVYHLHSPTRRDSTRWFQNRINNLVEQRCLRRVDLAIAVSQSVAHQMRNSLPQDRLLVVHNGVPITKLATPKRPPGDRWTLGMVALQRPRKGLEVLLEAVAGLKSHGRDVRLIVVGPFENRDYQLQIHRLTADLGIDSIVEWAGFQSDVQQWLAQMDLLVIPSLFGEGLPMVMLEAMSAGVPVIGTRVEGIPEAVRDGREGLLCQPGDAQALQQALTGVISGQVSWERLSRAAVVTQRRRFSSLAMARGIAGVYDRLLAGVSSRR